MKKPIVPTQSWLNEKGKAVAALMKKVGKSEGNVRTVWSEIGKIAKEVRDSAPRGSGMLNQFAEEFIGSRTAPVLISRAIWMFEHPKAVALVPERFTYPDSIVSEWGKLANKRLDAFVAHPRGNDLSAVAEELGVTEAKLKRRYNAALKRQSELYDKLSKIEEQENDLLENGQRVSNHGLSMPAPTLLYVLAAAKRTASQSRGFRELIEARNITPAAILLRAQLDTAIRINGLQYLDDREAQLSKFLQGSMKFNELVSSEKTKKGKPQKMQDWYLRNKLNERYPWVNEVYEKASGFAHLSFQHLFPGVLSTDDEKGKITFSITGMDQFNDETEYCAICDAFLVVNKTTNLMIVGFLEALRQVVVASESK